MATQVHEAANGKLKIDEEVEPLGELKGKEDLKKKQAAADLDVNGCGSLAEKEEPISKLPTPNKQKGIVLDGVEEGGANESQGGNDYSSEEDEGDAEEGKEDAREGDIEPYEEDNDEEYVDDGEDDDEGDDDDESQPPPKRKK